MKKIKFTLLIILCFSLLYAFSCTKTKIEREGEPDVFNVEEDNKQMNQAMQKARDTINTFIEYLKDPKD